MIKRWTNGSRQLFVFRLLSLFLVGSLLALADATANDLIKKVEDRYNGARTLSVNFVESYSLLGHPRPPESGTLTLRKQGKMRWDYTRPEGKLFISDGKSVYLYTATDNRVEKVPLKDTEDMRAPLAFLLGRLDLKKEFSSFRVQGATDGTWLDASAKNDRTPYENVNMLIASNGSIRQLKVVGRDGSLMSYSFANEKLNPAVGDQIFHFTIPPGAQVVDAVSFGTQEK